MDNELQARERCLEEKINRGTEAARAAIEIANVMRNCAPNVAMGRRREARQAAVQYHFWRDMQHGDARKEWKISGNFFRPNRASANSPSRLLMGWSRICRKSTNAFGDMPRITSFVASPPVDRNVLRLAIYEMLFRDDIPPVVSINEAIELAKKFGGAESGRFVNGILDRVRKELTRPARQAVVKSSVESRSDIPSARAERANSMDAVEVTSKVS